MGWTFDALSVECWVRLAKRPNSKYNRSPFLQVRLSVFSRSAQSFTSVNLSPLFCYFASMYVVFVRFLPIICSFVLPCFRFLVVLCLPVLLPMWSAYLDRLPSAGRHRSLASWRTTTPRRKHTNGEPSPDTWRETRNSLRLWFAKLCMALETNKNATVKNVAYHGSSHQSFSFASQSTMRSCPILLF